MAGVSPANIVDNYLAYHYEPLSENKNATIIGEESDIPYASTYLLTEIRSLDYVDRTNDGLTTDDLGGYVRFNYTKAAGTKSKSGSVDDWYRWRSPYNGLHYQRNALSDPFDDMGSVNSGYKEVYFLESIETKTHIASFVTESRKDGYEAVHDESVAASSQSATTAPAVGSGESTLHRLKKIELYAKDEGGEAGTLLVTVNLEHDYSLCKGLPNSEPGEGKLTLKKLWFEYEGVRNARISPFEFGYSYKTSGHFQHVPFTGSGEPYEEIVKYGDELDALAASMAPFDPQNPDYSPFANDRWGYYQYDGTSRYQKFNHWVNQKPESAFDPAAWQLKWIKLPSGGEVHVQYEQNDYRHVQHRPAMVMVNLEDRAKHDDEYTDYAIDVAEALPLVTDPGTGNPDPTKYEELLDSVKNRIQRYFIDGVNGSDPEHIFFRLVYALEGTNADLDRCSSEFITGYAKVNQVWTTNDAGLARKLWIRIGDPDKEYTLPDQVCENYIRTSRAGIIKRGSCNASQSGVLAVNDDVDVDDGWEAIWSLLGHFGDYYDSDENCRTVNLPDSYVRVPLPALRSKKGGGVRVKRVLTYDKGLEQEEDAALYGTEYLYETIDGLSSGVATNEPRVGREENSLVGLIEKRSSQNGYEKIFAGEDRSQFEGPIGESIMPSASVGYSRVVSRNIYTGNTTTGFVVNDFYTAFDYPFDLKHSTAGESVTNLGVSRTAINSPFDARYALLTGVFNRTYSSIRRAQGLRFVLNGMHGMPKRVSSYGGNYQRGVVPTAPLEVLVQEYYEPGEKIPVMVGSSHDDIVDAYLGKEMEVVFESREVREVTVDGSLQIDFGVGLALFLPIPFFSGSLGIGFGNTDNGLKTFVSSKVVRYPVVQKRAIAIKDGVRDSTEYLAFDPESGDPVLVRTADGYNNLSLMGAPEPHEGSYYSHSIPAWLHYPGFTQKARAERSKLYSDPSGTSSGFVINKRFVRENDNEYHYLVINATSPGGERTALERLFVGDLLNITDGDAGEHGHIGLYHVSKVVGNRVELLPTSFSTRTTLTQEPNVDVEIVHSGRSNRVASTAGRLTTYGLPPVVVDHPMGP